MKILPLAFAAFVNFVELVTAQIIFYTCLVKLYNRWQTEDQEAMKFYAFFCIFALAWSAYSSFCFKSVVKSIKETP